MTDRSNLEIFCEIRDVMTPDLMEPDVLEPDVLEPDAMKPAEIAQDVTNPVIDGNSTQIDLVEISHPPDIANQDSTETDIIYISPHTFKFQISKSGICSFESV